MQQHSSEWPVLSETGQQLTPRRRPLQTFTTSFLSLFSFCASFFSEHWIIEKSCDLHILCGCLELWISESILYLLQAQHSRGEKKTDLPCDEDPLCFCCLSPRLSFSLSRVWFTLNSRCAEDPQFHFQSDILITVFGACQKQVFSYYYKTLLMFF